MSWMDVLKVLALTAGILTIALGSFVGAIAIIKQIGKDMF